MNGGASTAAERDRLPDPGAGFVWDHGDAVPVLRAVVDGVRAGFTTRLGGVSEGPFASLNVSMVEGEDANRVVRNRRRASDVVGVTDTWTPIRQVHGSNVVRAGSHRGGVPDADGAWTDEPDRVVCVRAADCVPVLLLGDGRVCTAHAGWRGCMAGVVGSGVDAVDAREVFAGPAIGPCCFEVGSEVVSAFRDRFGSTVVADARHVDLWAAVEVAASEAGADHVRSARLCTSCHAELFFSHRRDNGRTGRQALLASIEA